MILRIIILSTISLLASLIMPWWIIALVAATFYFLQSVKISRSILEAFLAGLLLYAVMAIWQDSNVQRSAAELIGGILGGLPSIVAYTITGLLGGIIAGLGAWVGASLRNAVRTAE